MIKKHFKNLSPLWTVLTWLIVIVHIAPIAWMVWASLMGNNELMQGKLVPAPKSNDLIFADAHDSGDYIIGDRNGGLVRYNIQTGKYKKLNLNTTAASYLAKGDSLWVFSANKGLMLVSLEKMSVIKKQKWSWFKNDFNEIDHSYFTKQKVLQSLFEHENMHGQLAEMLNHYSLIPGAWRPSLAKVTGVVFPADSSVVDSLNKVISYPEMVEKVLEGGQEYNEWVNPMIINLFARKDLNDQEARELFRWCLAERFPVKLIRHQQMFWNNVWVSKIPSSGHGTSIKFCGDNTLCLALWWDDFPGIAFYDIVNEKTEWITLRHGLPTTAIQHLLPINKEKLLAVSDEGLLLIDLVEKDLEKVFLFGEAGLPYLDRSEIYCELLDDDNVLIAYGQDLLKFNFSLGEAENIQFKGLEGLISGVTSLHITTERVYLGTSEGVIITDKNFGTVQHIDELFIDVTTNRALDLVVHELQEIGDNTAILGAMGHLVVLEPKTGQVWLRQEFPQGMPDLNWQNYQDLWKSVPFGVFLRNSLVVCISVMLISMLVATFGGYAIARFDFPGKKFLSNGILSTQIIPNILYLIPIFLTFTALQQYLAINFINSWSGMIIVYSAFFIPMALWILQSVFASIPKELEEAALLDGCSAFEAFLKIALPVALPSIIAAGGYIFLLAWDELMFAWVLSTDLNSATIPVGVRLTAGQFQNRYDLLMAATTVATIPVLLLFLLLNKRLINSLSSEARGSS